MNLELESQAYRTLLTDLHQRINAGDKIDSVPFELFHKHVELTNRAINLLSTHIAKLQESTGELETVQNGTIDKLASAVRVLNINTKRLDEQQTIDVWTGHLPN